MKRLKFKKPFNGMDNAKKLIPESYKVDGNEFEITDGNETYRVKWSSSINEGIVLTSSNKAQINEDMGKMKHLMGFKSQETLGTVKGADRLDENKKFGDVLDKTKKLINESEETMGGPIPSDPYQADKNQNNKLISQVKSKFGLDDLIFTITVDKPEQEYRGGNGTLYVYAEKGGDSIEFQFDIEADLDYEGEPQDLYIEKEKSKYPNDYSEYVKFITQFITPEAYKELEENIDIEFEGLNEGEHIKSGMGGSNKGKSRTDKTEVLKKDSKKKRRKADKEATKDINENDVEAFQSALGDSPKVAAAAKKVNTRDEKFEAAIAYINNMVGDNDVLKSKIGRTLLKKDDVSELENPELADLNKDGELSSYEKKRGSAIEKAMNEFDGDEDEYEYYRRGGRELDDYLDDAEKEAKKAKESGIFKDDLPPGPSDEEEQAAQVYEDRFDEVFEGMYEEEDLNENIGDEEMDFLRTVKSTQPDLYNKYINLVKRKGLEFAVNDFHQYTDQGKADEKQRQRDLTKQEKLSNEISEIDEILSMVSQDEMGEFMAEFRSDLLKGVKRDYSRFGRNEKTSSISLLASAYVKANNLDQSMLKFQSPFDEDELSVFDGISEFILNNNRIYKIFQNKFDNKFRAIINAFL